jgi:hypothetical protein
LFAWRTFQKKKATTTDVSKSEVLLLRVFKNLNQLTVLLMKALKEFFLRSIWIKQVLKTQTSGKPVCCSMINLQTLRTIACSWMQWSPQNNGFIVNKKDPTFLKFINIQRRIDFTRNYQYLNILEKLL